MKNICTQIKIYSMDRITKSDLEVLRRQIVSDINHLLNKKIKDF